MAEKLPVYKLGTEPSFPADYDVVQQRVLNYTDVRKNNNKYYNLEVQVAKNGKARLFTEYGRVGASNPAREIRMCRDQAHAIQAADDIVRSKTNRSRDPYKEIQIVKSDIGSEIAKTKVQANKVSLESLEKAGIKLDEVKTESKLHIEVQKLVSTWFGSTAQFVEANLDSKRCPLGQLGLEQIAKGKSFLDEARTVVHTKKNIAKLDELTSLYYSNIPHVLPHRINADLLRFDTDEKIDKAYDILDVFQDAKNVQKVLTIKNNVDSQYETLGANIEFVDKNNPTWTWIEAMLQGTRAHNHSFLGKIKVHRIFKLGRNTEHDMFIKNAEAIAKSFGKQVMPDVMKKYIAERPDVPKELQDIYKRANILPMWHGTRKANMIGITRSGLLIRPSGVPHAGSLLGDAIYLACHSTKSINYCDSSGAYWSGGGSGTAFLLLLDAALGNQLITTSHRFYRKNEVNGKGYHSVWAKVGAGGTLINDEFTLYNATGKDQQHAIKYVIEFESKAR